MKNISKQRRQQFLYPELYEEVKGHFQKVREAIPTNLAWFATLDLGAVAEYANGFWRTADALTLEYTVGAPIEDIKAMYPAVVEAFEKWCDAKTEWQFNEFPEDRGNVEPTPVELEDLGSYQQMMRLFSLGVLLNEGALLRRAYTALGPWRGRDTVIEALVEDFIANPCEEAEGLFQFDLYDDLIGAAWAETSSDSARRMQKFLKSWYKAYRGQPWHDAHLRVGDIPEKPHWANYYGYWAFEAGALSYLYELDDTPWRDHMLYPKDLVDWARSQGRPEKPQPDPPKRQVLTAMPGEPCPESGEWYSVNWEDRRAVLKKGEPMPGPKQTSVGVVVWHRRTDAL